MKYIALFIFLISSSSLFAQEIDEDHMIDKDVPGYIIMTNNDTLQGKVKVSSRSKNQVRVKFTQQSSVKSRTYKAKDKKLIGYGYTTQENNDTRQIVYRKRDFRLKQADQPPVPFSSDIVFMEVKASGQVNLYSYYVESNTQVSSTYLHYYFMDSKYSDNTDEVRKRKVMREDFERITESFTEDCPVIRNKISISYDYSNLDRIVAEYNNCQNRKTIGKDGCNTCLEEQLESKRKLEELKRQQKLEEAKSATSDN